MPGGGADAARAFQQAQGKSSPGVPKLGNMLKVLGVDLGVGGGNPLIVAEQTAKLGGEAAVYEQYLMKQIQDAMAATPPAQAPNTPVPPVPGPPVDVLPDQGPPIQTPTGPQVPITNPVGQVPSPSGPSVPLGPGNMTQQPTPIPDIYGQIATQPQGWPTPQLPPSVPDNAQSQAATNPLVNPMGPQSMIGSPQSYQVQPMPSLIPNTGAPMQATPAPGDPSGVPNMGGMPSYIPVQNQQYRPPLPPNEYQGILDPYRMFAAHQSNPSWGMLGMLGRYGL